MNRAGNAINHPETIGPDPHTPGSPLPRAIFTNSVGYLPDGTPLNAAGNALNHPETMQPDMHTPGSPLPASYYAASMGYLVDGTPMSQAGNLSVQGPPPASQAPAAPAAPVAAPAAPPMVAASFTSTTEATHGIKFSYSMQKDAYADFEFINDVGYLPDGTPMNRAGNAINHPETIGPDPHTPGSPLPRAIFTNSVGYLPDGTPLNAAGNALNHPETMQPDMHTPGSPLPASYYAASMGYLVDGTPMSQAGNLSVQGVPAPAAPSAPAVPPMTAAPVPPPMYVVEEPVAAAFVGASANVGSAQKRADKRVPTGFLYSVQKDAYADLTFGNDVGYLPDGTPMNRAGNAINHPENIGPDPHSPGSPLPRAIFVNDIGYLPDGTPMNKAGNAINHPETIGPDPHSPGSELPPSVYAADIGYLVDGTDLATAGNLSVQEKNVAVKAAEAVAAALSTGMSSVPTGTSMPETAPVAAAFVGSSAPGEGMRQPTGFAYSIQKDVYADFSFTNDVGYLPDGTPMNKAGNCMNHPENIQPDPHAPGSPLPRANFVNDVGYLPDGTPMNRAGNAINHPETIQADPHSPGSALPPSAYAADVGYLVDGTPLDAAGNNAVH